MRRFQCRCRRLCLSSLIGTLRSNDATATRTSLKKVCLRSFSLYSDYSYKNFVKCRRTLLKLNFKGPYPSSEREIKFRRCLFMSSIKHEIRHFHVVVVQKRERNVQNKCDARAICCFVCKTYCFLTFSSPSASLDLKVPNISVKRLRSDRPL